MRLLFYERAQLKRLLTWNRSRKGIKAAENLSGPVGSATGDVVLSATDIGTGGSGWFSITKAPSSGVKDMTWWLFVNKFKRCSQRTTICCRVMLRKTRCRWTRCWNFVPRRNLKWVGIEV